MAAYHKNTPDALVIWRVSTLVNGIGVACSATNSLEHGQGMMDEFPLLVISRWGV